MTQPWHKTETFIDTKTFSTQFWQQHRVAIESGEFWADEIKGLRGAPVERLRLAINNLPLPAAFREAAIAVRALIRERRKNSESIEDHLTLLYWLAAISSFSIPFSQRLKAPGFNVIQAVPGAVLKALSYSYSELGYKELELLSATDIKWFVEAWAEPQSHSTLYELHKQLWREYEDKLIDEHKAQDQRLISELRALLIREN